MPYLAAAPYTDAASGSKMPPTVGAAAAGKPHMPASVTYPLVNVPGPENNNSAAGSPCTTPYHPSTPLRYHHAGGGGGAATSRAGCYASHHSATSFYNTNSGALAGTGGTSHMTSLPSNELQEYISMTSPASDFYYYSPQPFYLESPVPCAAAELYGSPHTPSFVSNVALPPPIMGSYRYINGDSTAGAAGVTAPNTPSLISSMNVSGSRFPQWYLPRGFCGSPMAAAATSYSTTGVYSGGMPGYSSYVPSSTPTNVAILPHSAEEDALSCEDGSTSLRGAQGLPLPPRLSPQSNSSAVGPLALPPSVVGGAALSSSVSSPTYRSGRPQPFVPYDGRAYGLPMHRNISCAEAAVAIARSALATDSHVNDNAINRGLHHASRQQQQQQQAVPCSSGADKTEEMPTATSAVSPAEKDATPVKMEGEAAYSPKEKTLLVDAHTRLAKLRAKALEEQQEQQQRQRTRPALHAKSVPVTPLSSPSTTPTSVEVGHTLLAASAAARRQGDAGPHVAPPEASDEAEIAISPIPPLSGSGDGGSARQEDSLLDEIELSQPQIVSGEAAAEVDTRAVLEQVLSVPGVKWRHDPYSRRVLVQPTSPSNTEEGDEGETAEEGHRRQQRHSSSSSGSETSTSQTGQQQQSSTAGHKRPTPTSSVLHGSSDTVPTQPPGSRNVSLDTQASHDDGGSSSSSTERVKAQPSARRVPIKKVCVRHFVSVSGGSEGHPVPSADGAVGVLVEVVSQPSPALHSGAARQSQLPQNATGRARRSSSCPAAGTSVTSKSLGSAVPPPKEPQQRERGSGSSEGVAEGAVVVVATTTEKCVPPPRSKQQHHDAMVCNSTSATTETAAAAVLRCDEVASRHCDKVAASSSSDGEDNVSPVVRADPALKRVGPFASSSSAADAFSAGQCAASWAWRVRTAQELPSVTVGATAAGPGLMSTIAAKWSSGEAVSTTADVDTHLLVRLWRQLSGSGCFHDVLEARERKLGADINSSTGVVSRSSARRSSYRRGGGVSGAEDDGSVAAGGKSKRLRAAMLQETEVTHVYVLRHRYRTSCAVATCRYEYGTEVVVDGDMGVDTGVVVLVVTKAEYNQLTSHERQAANLAPSLDDALAESIHRPVVAEEVLVRATTQRPLEDATLGFVRYLATQPHLFHSCRIACMNFVDVEFQADGQKLYVYYQTSAAVRFLELATYLNHVFHCRIWMKLAKGY